MGENLMARIYGALGAEKTLIEKLREKEVRSLNSLSEVEHHLKHSDSILAELRESERSRIAEELKQMKEQHGTLMETRTRQRIARRDILVQELEELKETLGKPTVKTRNPIKWLVQAYRRSRDSKRRKILEEQFMEEVDRPFRKLFNTIRDLEKRMDNAKNNTDAMIAQRLAPQIRKKQIIDRVLESNQTWLSGARGEREVVRTLAGLPDTFVVINDINLLLAPPLKSKEGLRFRCQADHVVIGPSGVFNVETKNWSPRSIRNLDLRSPVDQVRLTGKALWRDINRAASNKKIRIANHHWGEKSIQVRNILAMVGAMPNIKFDFVTMLPVNRLRGYLERLELTLERDEVDSIAKWLLDVSED